MPDELDPKRPVYAPGSKQEKIVRMVVVFSEIATVLGLLAICISFNSDLLGPKKVVVATLAAICAVVPPVWGAAEYFLLYRRHGLPGTFDLFKQGQQIAFGIWVGFTSILVVLLTSDFVKEEKEEYKCEFVPVGLPESSPVTFNLKCSGVRKTPVQKTVSGSK